MIPDFVIEKENVWSFLHETKLPIFIYGMGDGAVKILDCFERFGISCAGFFASDEFVRGHSFMGHLVHKLSEIEESVEEFIVVIAFGAGYKSLYDRIFEISKRHIVLAPDVPVYGDGLFTLEYVEEHCEDIIKVYNLLADEGSRKTFSNVINYKISGKIKYLDECVALDEEIHDLIDLGSNETYIDMGAYNGDTVKEFCEMVEGKYSKIYALEPDERNYRKLVKNTEEISDIHLFNAAAWCEDTILEFADRTGRRSSLTPHSITNESKMKKKEVVALSGDSLTENATFIKMDVEGAEKQAIDGCKASIKNGAKLDIALYHRTEDIFEIPLQIYGINPEYKFYIRHKLYIPAWETNLYCK